MARYRRIDTNPKFIPVDLAQQLLPGTFEHALNHLLDYELDLSSFDERFRNDATRCTGISARCAAQADPVSPTRAGL
jgi:hypothetical protein